MVAATGGFGIQLFGDRNTVVKSTITNSLFGGIRVQGASNNVLTGNVVFVNDESGILLTGGPAIA